MNHDAANQYNEFWSWPQRRFSLAVEYCGNLLWHNWRKTPVLSSRAGGVTEIKVRWLVSTFVGPQRGLMRRHLFNERSGRRYERNLLPSCKHGFDRTLIYFLTTAVQHMRLCLDFGFLIFQRKSNPLLPGNSTGEREG